LNVNFVGHQKKRKVVVVKREVVSKIGQALIALMARLLSNELLYE
jgi:hypothetical protein